MCKIYVMYVYIHIVWHEQLWRMFWNNKKSVCVNVYYVCIYVVWQLYKVPWFSEIFFCQSLIFQG